MPCSVCLQVVCTFAGFGKRAREIATLVRVLAAQLPATHFVSAQCAFWPNLASMWLLEDVPSGKPASTSHHKRTFSPRLQPDFRRGEYHKC